MRVVTGRILVFSIAILALHHAHAEDRVVPDEFNSAILHLRSVERIETPYIGFAANPAPRRFYKLLKVCLTYGGTEDFKDLLKDANPMVRLMGLACLAKVDVARHAHVFESSMTDRGTVGMLQGCVASQVTVGELARRLVADPDYLEFREWQTPEKRRLTTESSGAQTSHARRRPRS